MAKKADRIIIYLACTECKDRNYTTSKNKRNDPTGWNSRSSARAVASTGYTAKPSK